VRAALMWKEWREQRWRFALGSVVLGGLLAGLLRAQVIPPGEAALLIYWPVGVIMVIFLAMGPVATERADRTWEFLLARPVSRAQVLRAKWAVGVLQLVGMLAIATVAGMLAMWSRGVRLTPDVVADIQQESNRAALLGYPEQIGFAQFPLSHPFLWLGLVACMAAVSLACWYTPLMLILSRARNELGAALGGILLTIALHAWVAQFAAYALGYKALLLPAVFNPLSPMVFVLTPNPPLFRAWGHTWGEVMPALALVTAFYIAIWIVLPVALIRNRSGRGEST
jgi:ABC-type Na+ efflux pump permease subunit